MNACFGLLSVAGTFHENPKSQHSLLKREVYPAVMSKYCFKLLPSLIGFDDKTT
ncbi:hypothetical protein T4B_2271, partial [Trichinella pseudospiralis]